MKHVSRLTLIMILLLVIATPVLANEPQVINFAKAVELTLENNLDLKIAALTLANSQIDLEKSQLMDNADTRTQQLNLELEMAKSQDAYRTTRYNVLYSLLTDFTELTKKHQTITANETLLKIKELDLKLTKDLYAKGSATNTDVKNAQNAVEDQKLTLQKSQEDYAKLIKNLKSETGLIGDVKFTELTLDHTLVKIELAKALEQSLNTSFNLKDKDIRDKLALLELEKGEFENKPALEMKKLSNNKEMAWYRYLQAKDELSQNVEDQIWNLEQIAKTLKLRKTDLEVANENYQQTLSGYKKGHYTENQYLQAMNTQLNAEKALYAVKVDYTLRYVQLQNLLGNDAVIGGDLK